MRPVHAEESDAPPLAGDGAMVNASDVMIADLVKENERKTREIVEEAVIKATAVGKKIKEQLEATENDPMLEDGGGSVLEARTRRQWLAGMVLIWALPTACCVWYAAAIFFPRRPQQLVPAILWTPGATTWVNGTLTCCPKPSLCAEGWVQFWLLVAARLSAFAMYPSLLLVFLSKCHATMRFLSRSFVAELVPLSHLHGTHTFQGIVLASLALLHTLVHLVRWGLREELRTFCGSWAGLSGLRAVEGA